MSVIVVAFSKVQAKYKIDVLFSTKATFRLTFSCERLNKILSTTGVSESIMNVVDVSKHDSSPLFLIA